MIPSYHYLNGRPDYTFDLGRLALSFGVRAHSSVLDVGCGPGRSSLWISSHMPNATVFGIDPSSANIAIAKRVSTALPNLRFQVGSAEDFQIQDIVFDAVIAASALEWFDRAAFRDSCRLVTNENTLYYFLWSWLDCRDYLSRQVYRFMRSQMGSQLGPDPDESLMCARSFVRLRRERSISGAHKFTRDRFTAFLSSSSYWRADLHDASMAAAHILFRELAGESNYVVMWFSEYAIYGQGLLC